jgi:hypothetical protein
MAEEQKTGRKDDAGKAKLSLLSTVANFKTAQVMTDGERRYGAHNWRGGLAYSRLLDAAGRHLEMWKAGMDNDPDSGKSNLAHARCCIDMLLEFEETRPDLDDRYKLPMDVLTKLYPPKETP